MTRYWLVNHKQTARQEIEGQYLWSPKTSSNGARNQFYDNVRRADPGDLVLSFANGLIKWVGRVAEFAFTAPKPTEFGTTGSNWHDEGWLLPVFWTELDPPVRPKAMINVLGSLLPKKYSPIRPLTGDGNQGVYLAEVAKSVFDAIVAASAVNHPLLARGGANSLSFRSVKEMLEDRAEQGIRTDAGLDTTTKEAVIQARRGQGRFRANVERVEAACRLTKITNPSLLIASHIKPWRSCETAEERLDGMNGLLLTPDADLLFDRGFITFHDDGEVQISPRFDDEDLRRLGLGEIAMPRLGFGEAQRPWRTEAFAIQQRKYLAHHRAAVYVGD
jgi:putative restriction endonuclease